MKLRAVRAAVPARPALWLRAAHALLSVLPLRAASFGQRAAQAIPVASVGVVIAAAHGKLHTTLFYNTKFNIRSYNVYVEIHFKVSLI